MRIFTPKEEVPFAGHPTLGTAHIIQDKILQGKAGNGCLAGYLVKHRYFGQDQINIRSEQGYEIGRPSLLFLSADQTGEKINIAVGGRSIVVAEGAFI